MPQFGGPAD